MVRYITDPFGPVRRPRPVSKPLHGPVSIGDVETEPLSGQLRTGPHLGPVSEDKLLTSDRSHNSRVLHSTSDRSR
jgi:hypothetical protein